MPGQRAHSVEDRRLTDANRAAGVLGDPIVLLGQTRAGDDHNCGSHCANQEAANRLSTCPKIIPCDERPRPSYDNTELILDEY